MEYELRKLELTRRTDRYEKQEGEEGENMELGWRAAGHPRQDTLVGRTKIFGDAMCHVLPKMPSETAEIPQFFETVEKLFVMYEVPDDLKCHVHFHSVEVARSLFARWRECAL